MSDEEEYSSEEEEEEVKPPPKPAPKAAPPPKKVESPPPKDDQPPPGMTEAELVLWESKKRHQAEERQKWNEYQDIRKLEREKEEEELAKLREHQKTRVSEREVEANKMAEVRAKIEEERSQMEVEMRKKREVEKRKRAEAAARRRAELQNIFGKDDSADRPEQKQTQQKKTDDFDDEDKPKMSASSQYEFGGIPKQVNDPKKKTVEQLAEEKRQILAQRIKPVNVSNLSDDRLRMCAKELHDKIMKLELERYEAEEKVKRQKYDMKELTERKKQIDRQRAIKKGLDVESLQSGHPPKIEVASKYERQIDRRTFGERKDIYLKVDKPAEKPTAAAPKAEEPAPEETAAEE